MRSLKSIDASGSVHDDQDTETETHRNVQDGRRPDSGHGDPGRRKQLTLCFQRRSRSARGAPCRSRFEAGHQAGHRPHDLAGGQTDVVLQEHGGGPHVRTNHLARQFAKSRLLHPAPTLGIGAAARGVTKAGHHALTVDPIFLEMIVGRAIGPGLDRSVAVWAMAWYWNENQLIELAGPLAIPAGMAYRRSAFLLAWGCGRIGFILGRFFFLAFELLLAFGLQLPLKLLDPGGKFHDLVRLGGVLCLQGIDPPQQRVGPLRLLVRGENQPTQRRAAQVWAVIHMQTTKIVFGVELELHRRPFLGERERCRYSTLLLGMAQ